MRRTAITLAVVALLGGSCGRSDLAPGVTDRLERRVALVRQAAEAGAPRMALTRLEELTGLVGTLVDQGRIEEDRALEILASVEAVKAQLGLLPIRSTSPTTSPSPSAEQGHEGKGNGDGDKGHGKDD